MFSDWSRCTASSPFATCTSRIAPAFFAASSTSCLSRCHRSSLSVSMEKPMRTGPPAAALVLWLEPLVLVVLSCGALMQDTARTALRNNGQIFLMSQLLPQERFTTEGTKETKGEGKNQSFVPFAVISNRPSSPEEESGAIQTLYSPASVAQPEGDQYCRSRGEIVNVTRRDSPGCSAIF